MGKMGKDTSRGVAHGAFSGIGLADTAMARIFLALLSFLLAAPATAEDAALADPFVRRGIEGTMVISSLRGGERRIHNDSRANRRFSPASTFKMLNTLIALEERAIAGKDDVLPWNGHRYAIPDWNRDQTLKSAFRVSCVWCFQELAARIGARKYRDYLRRTGYGTLHQPFEEKTFWLDGALQISAAEQVEFLDKVYRRALPFSPSSYQTLREIMVVEQTPTVTIRAKTGWATQANPQVGWYVGYVETQNDVWFFASNIVVRDEKDLPLRRELTREALQTAGIME
uniref:beta-lactamase n=1 Tax=Candidatus Kentrum sp. DK TaxID=2126562 RepID=A0A450S066_9GAMM|nr:MAG: beta-lactamase class D [Candidatus Kentron sp. DK]VFJ52603.1 MAG: beta-lactamase class D [Candidatus Kentron sp. DK]